MSTTTPVQWNRIVYCPFCNWMATLKPTKTKVNATM
jgi:hypothetical protein